MTPREWAVVGVVLAAVAASWIATAVARRVAHARGMLDPVEARRIHTVPTPRFGGAGVLVGLLVGAFIGWWADSRPGSDAGWPFLAFDPLDPRLVGCLSFFGLGALDDLPKRGRGLSAAAKLALQAAAAAMLALAMGLRFQGAVAGPVRAAGWPDLAFADGSAFWTVAWIVAVVNLLNFLDGIDSILATTAIVVLSAGAAWTLGASSPLALAGVGALLGFAAWNASPARIFLGDGGSHVVAFLVASLPCAVAAPGGGAPASGGVPWPLVAAPLLPAVVDVAEALLHKARHGIPMSQAHHDHLYQRLAKAGWSHGAVALRYGALSLIGVVLAGPVAHRLGALAAGGIGAVVMAVHLGAAARTTRGVARLAKS